jgi:hypothetical protein
MCGFDENIFQNEKIRYQSESEKEEENESENEIESRYSIFKSITIH